MAKKNTTPKKKTKKQEQPSSTLPQNILSVGEHVEQDKNIYISQKAYKTIHKFTRNKTVNESGGVLVGRIVEELGKTNILIEGFIEARHTDATPTTLTFTHNTWDYIHKEADKRWAGKKILGWIHTHPDFGIFLSEYDKFIHENFFSEENQVAYVVDPIQHIEGFYFWIDGKLERCNGFYIYDKEGATIDVDPQKEARDAERRSKIFSFQNVLLTILSLAVVFLSFSQLNLLSEINSLKDDQKALTNNIAQFSYYISILDQQVGFLTEEIVQIESIVLPQPDATTDGTESADDTDDTGDTEDTNGQS